MLLSKLILPHKAVVTLIEKLKMVGEFKSKGFLRLFLRGVLGGVGGASVFAAVEVCLIRPTGWDNWLGYFLLIFIISLPFSVLAGAILAVVLWLMYQQTGVHFGLLARAFSGTVIGTIMIGIWWAITSNPYKQSYERNSWFTGLVGPVLLGAAFGGIPGILIGSQRQREPSPKVDTVNNGLESSIVNTENR